MSKNCNQNCDCNTDYLPPCPPCGDIPLPPPRPLPPIPGGNCPPPPCNNNTPYYGLPLWKASDVTSWLMQMNGAMMRIDTIMHDLALRTGINGLPDDLVTSVSKLCQDVEVLKCTVGELGNKQANVELLMQNINTQFSAMKTDLSSMQLSLTNLDTRIMTVDSANQAIRNDVTMLKSDMNMINSTLSSLQKNFTQYQLATNQTLAEIQAQLTDKADKVETNELLLSLIGDTTSSPENYQLTKDMIKFPDGVTLNENSNLSGFNFIVRKVGNIALIYMRSMNSLLLDIDKTTFTENHLEIDINLRKFNIPRALISSGYARQTFCYKEDGGASTIYACPGALYLAFTNTTETGIMDYMRIQCQFTDVTNIPTKLRIYQVSGELTGTFGLSQKNPDYSGVS